MTNNSTEGIYSSISNYIIDIYNTSGIAVFLSTVCSCILSTFYCDMYLVELYILFSILNFIAGISLAIKKDIFSIKKSVEWIFKLSIGLFTIYALGILLHAITLVTGFQLSVVIVNTVLNLVVLLLIFTEATSSLSNGVLLGLPIPKVVITIVSKLDNRIKDKLDNVVNMIEDSNVK